MKVGYARVSTLEQSPDLQHDALTLAEFEPNLIRERTRAGLSAARARGPMGGRKPKLRPAQVKTLRRMYDSRQHTVKEICKVMGISRPTLYQYLKDKGPETEKRSKAPA